MAKKLDDAVNTLQKRFGAGAVTKLGDAPQMIDRFTSGSLRLDYSVLGGGVPRGRIIEIYGPESCLAGDTFLQFEVRSSDGQQKNSKGGTIKRLYERFHDVDMGGPKQGRHLQHKENVKFYVKSINEASRVIRNEVLDVVATGVKPVYRVKTNKGFTVDATLDHKFLTPTGYKPLRELAVSDTLFVHNNTHYKTGKGCDRRPMIMVKYHPMFTPKRVGDYTYYRGQKSRFAYEAHVNGFDTPVAYKYFLDNEPKETIDQLWFVPKNLHVHHIDENFNNDAWDNLMLIDPVEHGRHHATIAHNNLRFIVVEDVIESIVAVGETATYDLKCAFPYNNYIANGIVVHNSGKTTVCQHIIAEAQKLGGTCAFVDMEHAFDPTYAERCGVNIAELLFSQPDTGEQALEIAETLIKSGEVAVLVVDSVAALVPRAELEGEMGDAHMGLQARLMSQALRKLVGITKQTNTVLIFTNQLRQKIGVVFGNPEITSGGNALKFYASIRLDMRRTGSEKEGGEVVGNNIKIKCKKNKTAPPFGECDLIIRYKEGLDKYDEVVELGVEHGFIQKSGAWFSLIDDNGEILVKLQGKPQMRNWLRDNTSAYDMLYAAITDKLLTKAV